MSICHERPLCLLCSITHNQLPITCRQRWDLSAFGGLHRGDLETHNRMPAPLNFSLENRAGDLTGVKPIQPGHDSDSKAYFPGTAN